MPKNFSKRGNVRFDLPVSAMEKWNPAIRAAESGSNDIGIFDVIGEGYWNEGVTASSISSALKRIGADKPVTVNINSPGGDMFEGLAIYNLLKEHKGEVTVKVVGLAASAASIIAMAGDSVEIARAGFLMIHNAWLIAAGNRHELKDIAEWLEPFDRAMGSVYEARTGLDSAEIESMMDSETWLGGKDAIEQGFADEFLPSDQIEEDAKASGQRLAAHQIDLVLAKAGIPRSERRKLLNDIKPGTHDAAGAGTRDAAGVDTLRAIEKKKTDGSALELLFNSIPKAGGKNGI